MKPTIAWVSDSPRLRGEADGKERVGVRKGPGENAATRSIFREFILNRNEPTIFLQVPVHLSRL